MAERGKRSVQINLFSNTLKERLKDEIKTELRDEFKEEFGLKSIKTEEKRPAISEKSYGPNSKRKSLRVLIILVVIVLIMDFIVFAVYLNSNSIKTTGHSIIENLKNQNNDSSKCSDGTSLDTCSKDKPMYCYQGKLTEMASLCGCPDGYVLDFQDCKKVN